MSSPTTGMIAFAIALVPSLLQAETVTKRVALDGIRHVHLLGNYDLVVKQGTDEFVELTTDSDAINEIEAKVQGSKLALGKGRDSGWVLIIDSDEEEDKEGTDATFFVQLNTLRSVNNMGPGNVSVEGIDTDDDLAFSNMGTGRISLRNVNAEDIELANFGPGRYALDGVKADDIEEGTFGVGKSTYSNVHAESFELSSYGVSGTTLDGSSTFEELKISINGAGELDADDVAVKKAEISINGAGVTYINVTETLDVNISGDGKIYYRGDPEIKKSVHGSGQVRPLN